MYQQNHGDDTTVEPYRSGVPDSILFIFVTQRSRTRGVCTTVRPQQHRPKETDTH
jgi:hypothetical protein